MMTLARTSGSLVILAAFCSSATADHESDRRRDHDRRDAVVTIGNVLSLIAGRDDHGRGRFDRGHDHHARHDHDRHARGHGRHDHGRHGRNDHGRHGHGGFGRGHGHHDHGGRGPAFNSRLGNSGFQFHLALGNRPAARPVQPIGGPHLIGPQPVLPPLPGDAPLLGGVRVGSVVGGGVPLYHRVRVKDRDNIAPDAVPQIIAVRDPNGCDHYCDCCPRQCVFVEVWMPRCACSKIDVRKHGRRIKYDFGEYEIEIESKNGVVTVDYDD